MSEDNKPFDTHDGLDEAEDINTIDDMAETGGDGENKDIDKFINREMGQVKAVKETPSKHPGGRPRKEVDYVMVERLAHIMCTQEEIASILGMDLRGLQRNPEFIRVFEKGKEGGKASLRRIQWRHAKNNVTMAIWLGKQYLGQRDAIETIEKTENIEIVNDVPKPKKQSMKTEGKDK